VDGDVSIGIALHQLAIKNTSEKSSAHVRLMVKIKHDIGSERIPAYPPAIFPVPTGVERPYWSVMIPVYNCSQFLPETIASVLQQYPGRKKMQVEVIDDGSTDANVEAIVKTVGKGLVRYYRQPKNVGSLRNFQTCIERANGRWVHILHGDDRVNAGFYSNFEKLFTVNPQWGAAFCRYAYIDAKGRWMYDQEKELNSPGTLTNWIERLGERQRIQYVAMVVKRDVYEQLGSFYKVEYGEDWEMWMRIASHYEVGYSPETLAEYRRHFASISGKSFATGQNMRDLRWVMDEIGHYLPANKKKRIRNKSNMFYAYYALKIANALWTECKHHSGAKAQMREAWNTHKDPLLLYKIFKLHLRMTLNL
jgi:glycosyltransferase involved in cell wall biosynthesis